jgi:hypothetical protein
MTDRRVRPWIKQRLAESEDATQAYRIWKRWKSLRQAASNVARSIRLYEALLQGDTDKFHKLMMKYFPGYGLAQGLGQGGQVTAPPASVTYQPTNRVRNGTSPAHIVIKAEAYNEEEEDDFGFAKLEIG